MQAGPLKVGTQRRLRGQGSVRGARPPRSASGSLISPFSLSLSKTVLRGHIENQPFFQKRKISMEVFKAFKTHQALSV